MNDPRTRTCTTPECVAEETALAALLAIEHAWADAHRDGTLAPDVWGEGPSRLRLADLGLDTRLRTHSMYGICSVHGGFTYDWDGLPHEEPPEEARCTATSGGRRCALLGPVAKRRDDSPVQR